MHLAGGISPGNSVEWPTVADPLAVWGSGVSATLNMPNLDRAAREVSLTKQPSGQHDSRIVYSIQYLGNLGC